MQYVLSIDSTVNTVKYFHEVKNKIVLFNMFNEPLKSGIDLSKAFDTINFEYFTLFVTSLHMIRQTDIWSKLQNWV